MNRQTRRHPIHPTLPLLYPEKHRIPDIKVGKTCSRSLMQKKKHQRFFNIASFSLAL